jgi:integrase
MPQPGEFALDPAMTPLRILTRQPQHKLLRLHDLRHGAATHALAAGVDARVVKETLGHSSTSFTRDTYQSVVDELKHQAAAALADVFNQAGARTWGTSSS